MKSTYEISPAWFKQSDALESLSFMQKSILKEVLDITWVTDSQYLLPDNIESLIPHCSAEDIVEVISMLSAGEGAVFEYEMADLNDPFTLKVSCVWLKKQIMEFKNPVIDLGNQDFDQKISQIKPRERKSSRPHLTVVPVMIDSTPEVVYNNGLSLDCYSGYLPTSSFALNGQLLCVTSDMLQNLIEEFPHLDISNELSNLFDWLAQNDSKRRSYSMTVKLINNWMSNKSTAKETDRISLHGLANELENINF